MPKKLRDEPIYLAPQIKGYRDFNYHPVVVDERTNRLLNPNDIDDKVFIYERQVKEWFLNRASRLIKGGKNNFIVLMIATSYIEGVQQYLNGKDSNGRSKQFFRQGIRRIFGLQNIQDYQIDQFYVHVRCGLFHNGMSGDAVVLSRDFPNVITFSARGTIDINPTRFLQEIKNDFASVLRILKNRANQIERTNFDNMFTVV